MFPLIFSENEGMETFEIKLEVNGNYESYYSMEPVDSKSELVSCLIGLHLF